MQNRVQTRLNKWWWLVMIAALTLSGCGDDSTESPAADTSTSDTSTADTSTGDTTITDTSTADTVADTVADIADTTPPPELTGDWTALPPTEPTAGIDPNGADDVAPPLATGEVRAGVVSKIDDQIFTGSEGRCRIGDFKIYNKNVALCVEGPSSSSNILLGGGQIIDAIPLHRPGIEDALYISSPELALRAVNYSEVEVIRDGSDGEVAVIRATGKDDIIGMIFGLTNSTVLAPPGEDFDVVTEYRLYPDAPVLEIVSWISHPDRDYNRTTGDLFFLGDTARTFFEGDGLTSNAPGRSERIEAIAPGLSYGYYVEQEGPAPVLHINLGDTGIGPGLQPVSGKIPAGLTGAFRRYFVVGDGSTFATREAIETFLSVDVDRTPVEITLLEETTDLPIAGLVFEVIQTVEGEEVVIGAAQTDLNGVAAFNAPPGDYTMRFASWNDLAIANAPLNVAADPVAQTLTAPLAARLEVNVDAEALDSSPLGATSAKIRVSGPISRLVQSASGREVILVPPGDYTVTTSRGMEYSASSESVQLTAGPTPSAQVNVMLTHVLPTPGLIAGEFHQHAAPSIDSEVDVRDRVLSNLADGVDFMAPSDHDSAYDYNVPIRELGLEDKIFSLGGAEVSPLWGHFNGIGLPSDPAKPSYGSLPLLIHDEETSRLRPRTPSEIVRDLIEVSGAAMVQLNHARSSSQSTLDHVGYDPAQGPEAYPEHPFLTQFDVLEIFNGRGATCVLLRDWYSFLNRGQRVLVVGNSDTHNLSSPAGFPRNYIAASEDDPANLNAAIITDGLSTGDVTIAGGALITLGAGWALGATHSQTAGQAFDVPIRVSSPPWSRVTTLLTVVNGQVADTQTFDPLESDLIDFDGVVSLTLSGDAYVHFIAYSGERMSAVYTNEAPFSLTNPLYVDVDGDTNNDGEDYEAPGATATLPDNVDYDVCSF